MSRKSSEMSSMSQSINKGSVSIPVLEAPELVKDLQQKQSCNLRRKRFEYSSASEDFNVFSDADKTYHKTPITESSNTKEISIEQLRLRISDDGEGKCGLLKH